MFEGALTEVRRTAEIDPRDLARAEVVPALRAIEMLRSMLDGASVGLLARLEADQIFEDDQYVNAAACMEAETGVARWVANRQVKCARALRDLPATHVGLRTAAITMAHAEVLIAAVNVRTRDAMAVDEESFVTIASRMGFRAFANKVAEWKLFHDGDGSHDPGTEASTLRLSPGAFSRGMLQADLTPGDYVEFKAVLDVEIDRLFRQERTERELDCDGTPMRSHAQRAAEALMNIALAAANGNDLTMSAAAKATIGIVVTSEQFAASGCRNDHLPFAVGGHTIEDNIELLQSEVDRFLCDSSVYRAVMTASAEILDVGREVRTSTAAMKKALAIRDHGCIVPSCDAPPRWCEAHHVRWYRNGGHTVITNLVLLCRRHHTQLHRGSWSMHMNADQTYAFTRPDGSPLHARAHAPPGQVARN